MDLTEYRNSATEQDRINNLLDLIPRRGISVLDVGARDGYISLRLAENCDSVTALDLEKPTIENSKVFCVKGDITSLDFPDDVFDLVVCAEVLEHIPPQRLATACAELMRVAKGYLVIGVPFKQDTRVGRTTCHRCGKKNPPWGHVNVFNERRLRRLFSGVGLEKISYVGKDNSRTNFLSTWLMDLAGNPYGTYSQDEPCVYCGAKLANARERNLLQKGFTRSAVLLDRLQKRFHRPQPAWIHVLFAKRERVSRM